MIVLGKYKINFAESSVNRFNVYKRYLRKGNEDWEAEFFGVSFRRAVNIVINETLNDEDTENIDISVMEFVDKYENLYNKVEEKFFNKQ